MLLISSTSFLPPLRVQFNSFEAHQQMRAGKQGFARGFISYNVIKSMLFSQCLFSVVVKSLKQLSIINR